MSFFYLKPIEGTAQLHILEDCIFQRTSYFQELLKGQNGSYSEFLLEGSTFDNTGHFLLGLLARLSDSPPLLHFVNQGEEKLFQKRLNSAKPLDIRYMCKQILKWTKNNCGHSYLEALSMLCKKLIIKRVAEHVFDPYHSNYCNFYNIDINFVECLTLVSKRLVEIDKGVANIPCGVWKLFFTHLFKKHLDDKFINYRNNKYLHLDPRWREMIAKLIQNLSSNEKKSNYNLKHNNIDAEIDNFPLCMKNLHSVLREKHRLSHNERFRYSLFLKDIGLSLQESIYFWQSEYSKPCSGASCSHTWGKDEKKFVYGIRHLYGLEGARKDYKMPNCNMIKCNNSNEGGCAFKHFDNSYLDQIRNKNIPKDTWDLIINKKNAGLAGEACSVYKQAIITNIYNKTNIINDQNYIYSPINYFISIKEM